MIKISARGPVYFVLVDQISVNYSFFWYDNCADARNVKLKRSDSDSAPFFALKLNSSFSD